MAPLGMVEGGRVVTRNGVSQDVRGDARRRKEDMSKKIRSVQKYSYRGFC